MDTLIADNWIDNQAVVPLSGARCEKFDPATGALQTRVARSGAADADAAVQSSLRAFRAWRQETPVARGIILRRLASLLESRATEVAEVVASETGKSLADARGEAMGAAQLGFFMAGEGQRLYGRTTTSSVPNRRVLSVREPLGVCALVVAANTPIANVAWKAFPALISGNTAVLKAAEDTPLTALLFAKFAEEAGVPPGVFNVLQGLGPEAGAALVEHPDIALISFTGSDATGGVIAAAAAPRLTKLSLELGGKNPFVVCDDADLDLAVKFGLLSAFSNAGQRCAAASRFIVFESIYERFKTALVQGALGLRVGSADGDDLGPVINARAVKKLELAVESARADGGTILCGGSSASPTASPGGYYFAPTLIDHVSPASRVSQEEWFGPLACLHSVTSLREAVEVANGTPFGLTATIHTKDLDTALAFSEACTAGVINVNAATYGSEPHMPFGGFKRSGNGTREPGTEALDIYTNLKTITFTHRLPGLA